MSFDSGPGAVLPPFRRGRSPWLWVGLGCGLLLLVTFGGCAAFVYVVGKRAAEAVDRPLSKQQVIEALQKTPVYPGAQVDLPTSKQMLVVSEIANKTTGLVSGGKIKTGIGAFSVPAPPDKIIAWYDTQFAGWQKTNARSQPGLTNDTINVSASRQYARGGKQVQVQVGRRSGQEKESHLVLIVVSGIGQEGR